MKKNLAFIFPAFITDFTGKELLFLESNRSDINKYLHRISGALNLKLPHFTYESYFYREELASQLLAYSFSCAFSDLLKSKGLLPDYVAGYSMGVYASMYASESISFEQGARIIYEAFNLVRKLSETLIYGMGAVIGLTTEDTEALIKSKNLDVEIININNAHSLVVAGKSSDVKELLQDAKIEGALSVAELTVNTPYHSKYLIEYSNDFKNYLDNVCAGAPVIPVISTYNQRVVKSVGDIKTELVFNLTQKINWHKTMQKLIDLGVTEMYECGAGKGLKKISRFIDGDYSLKTVYKI